MKLSVNWLRELVDFPDDVEELCDRLTLLGLEVEELQEFSVAFPKVYVGEVLEAEPHPDADRLRVCRVRVEGDELSIVCGAPNVRAGLRVPVATVGAVLPGDFRIKKSKIRGQVSMGMICSEKELGLGAGHEGIMELDDSFELDRPFDDYYRYDDHVFEIEVTPNRPDWLSHIGVAREIAAWYGSELRLPDAGAELRTAGEDDGWTVRIDDPTGCPRFSAQMVDGVKVGPSPRWMRQRLMAIGQRPINAVVDASNYLLHECGHPNHCFDREKIHGNTVHIRRASEGERFTTLDDVERTLADHHLLVADEKGGMALAGIMGGADSEVGEGSTKLLLEVAAFDPLTIRRGRRAVGLNTDASYRFERGVDYEAVPWVSRRLATLIEEVAGGRAHRVLVDGRGAEPAPRPRFFVRAPQVERLLGVPMEPARMAELLGRLRIDAEPTEHDGVEGVELTAPSFRHDLLREVDALEELARMHGFDRFPAESRVPMITTARRTDTERLAQTVRQHLAARGYHEVVATAFQKAGDLDALSLSDDDPRRRTVEVLNPVVHDDSAMRTSAVPEMARIVDRNQRRGWTDPIRLFQWARTYVGRKGEALPDERDQLVVAWAGPAETVHPDAELRPVSLTDVHGELDGLFAQLGHALRREPGEAESYHRPGTTARLRVGETVVGTMGELSPATRRALDVEGEVLVAEIDTTALGALAGGRRRYEEISTFPPVRRDLSLVVPHGVRWADIVATFEANLGEILESQELFDVYEGEGLPPQTAALGVRLVLRSPNSTLKDKKVDRMLSKLLDDLAASHSIRIRSAVQ